MLLFCIIYINNILIKINITPPLIPKYIYLLHLYFNDSGNISCIDNVIIIPATNNNTIDIITSLIYLLKNKNAITAPRGSDKPNINVFCKAFFQKVAEYFWRMLHLQFGESCRGCPEAFRQRNRPLHTFTFV